jgi:glycosyltransferase involved in cell wall biosynthesis
VEAAVSVIIPAVNEERSIGLVLGAIPKDVAAQVIVVDNGSDDRTADVARSCGARVVAEPTRGYGAACLKGIRSLRNPDVVVFLDADYSDYPEDMKSLVEPIIQGKADIVVGTRSPRTAEKGALPPHQVLGNRLACFLIYVLWGTRFADLGPFRAIRFDALKRINMTDANFGWNVEMQIKALKKKLRIVEVPVRYRKRIGRSKISGTISGSLTAGAKIIYSIFRYSFIT